MVNWREPGKVDTQGPLIDVAGSWVHVDFVGIIETVTTPVGELVAVSLRDGQVRKEFRHEVRLKDYLRAFAEAFEETHGRERR